MSNKKYLIIFTISFLFLGCPQIVNACENKYSYSAYGYLDQESLDELKRRYRNTNIQIGRENQLSIWDVQGIMGFYGQQIKVSNNGRVEKWIWADLNNCRRKIKAAFRDDELVKINSYGF